MTTNSNLPTNPAANSLGKPAREYEAMLAASTDAKKRNNLARVWAALEDMRTRKERDFTLASVAKAVERLGLPGPKYQSIRNKDGAHFRALIDVYRQTHGRAQGAQESDDGDEDLPLAIADPRLQQRVRVLMRHARALEDRNKILHEQVARFKDALPLTPTVPSTAAPEGASRFTAEEIYAVTRFLERAESVGLTTDYATGCILDRRSQKEIAPPYFLDALRRILDTSGRAPVQN